MGCKDEKTFDGPMPQPSKAKPPGHDLDTGKRVSALDEAIAKKTAEEHAGSDPDSRNQRTGMSQEQLLAIRRTVPPFGGLDAVEPLDVLPHSRLARLVLCSSHDVKKTTTIVVRDLKDKQWVDLATHTPPRDQDRRTFTANHEDFRVTGSIYMASTEDCHKDQGRVRVSMSFQERQPSKAKLEELEKKKLAAPLKPPARPPSDAGSGAKKPK